MAWEGANLAQGGTCEGREGTKRPAGCPTSAGKLERKRFSGGEVKYEVGRPHVKQQLQHSARGAPRRRKVNRSSSAGAEWSSRSRAAAAEDGSMRCRGSGNVVGGVLAAISMSDETETSGLQQPGQHSKPVRVLETKQKCIRVNRMECDTNITDTSTRRRRDKEHWRH